MTPNYRQLSDPQQQVELAVENLLTSHIYPGWNIPRLVADFGTVSTAAYWGGRVRLPVGGCLSIEPIIYSAEQADLATPGEPSGGDCARGLKLYRDVCDRLETDQLYTTTMDIQGPLNTAALIWEQSDFMVAMLETPDAVHRFLDRVTNHLISIIECYIQGAGGRICGNVWPYIWLPPDIGIGITEDYMPLLSAAMYREFGLPYVERISQRFGGLFVHCCGTYEHQLRNLRESSMNLLGLEFSYPYTRPEALFETFGDSVVFVPQLGPKGVEEFENKASFFKNLLQRMQPDTRMWFIVHPEEADYQNQLAVVEGSL